MASIDQDMLLWIFVGGIIGGWIAGAIGYWKMRFNGMIILGILGAAVGAIVGWYLWGHQEWLRIGG